MNFRNYYFNRKHHHSSKILDDRVGNHHAPLTNPLCNLNDKHVGIVHCMTNRYRLHPYMILNKWNKISDCKEWNDYVLKDQSHPSVYWISKSVDLRKYHPSQLHLDLVPLHLYHLLYQSMHYVVMYPSCEAMIALHFRYHLVSLSLSVQGKDVSLNDFRCIND